MISLGIDIGKNKHVFTIVDLETGNVIGKPMTIQNNIDGFKKLEETIKSYSKDNIKIGMEDTGHYHFNLLWYLIDKGYDVYLINPVTTDADRKLTRNITKNDELDSLQIAEILDYPERKKLYRKVDKSFFELNEMKSLTRLHSDLTEALNPVGNKIQKSLDMLFPEFNSLFSSHYGKTYMNILKAFKSAASIAKADIKEIRKVMNQSGRGRRVRFTAEDLKALAQRSVAMPNIGEEYALESHLNQYMLLNEELTKVDKKIEEFSKKTNSPILTIPGISHTSCITILAEIRRISNFNSVSKLTKYIGVAPMHYESSQYEQRHSAITKKGNKYLRKVLYQVITPVINNNKVFKDFYDKKRSEGKSHRCAQGHCVRKLIRILFHILTTGELFDSAKLV